jgi:hypothetical protein
MFSKKWLGCIAGLAAMTAAQSASAYVQCNNFKVESILSTENGTIHIFWVGGLMSSIAKTDDDQKATLALATTALALDLPVSVRFDDGASCTGNSQLITGFQLNRL